MKNSSILLVGLCLMILQGVVLAEEFDLRKAFLKCYAQIPTDRYGAWAEKEYQRLQEDCYNTQPDPLCRRLCFLFEAPHHSILSIIMADKAGKWSFQNMTSLITFDTIGLDLASKVPFKPGATPDNPNPAPTTVHALANEITDKLNEKIETCASKVFTAADGKADTCEKLGEDDKKKLAELVECIEKALTC